MDLEIEYDTSTFDTNPFEPQSDGMGTIFPFWVDGNPAQNGYSRTPLYTSTGFHYICYHETKILGSGRKNWIAEKRGMVLLNTHPEYMDFNDKGLHIEEYPAKHCVEFLKY